jgi:hypothetical protein
MTWLIGIPTGSAGVSPASLHQDTTRQRPSATLRHSGTGSGRHLSFAQRAPAEKLMNEAGETPALQWGRSNKEES